MIAKLMSSKLYDIEHCDFFLQGLKERTLGKGKTFRASRKIKKYDEDFDPKSFATETAVDVYTKAHMALSE